MHEKHGVAFFCLVGAGERSFLFFLRPDFAAHRHGVVAVLRDDAVLDERDVERAEVHGKRLRGRDVVLRGRHGAVRVVVGENDADRAAHDGVAHDVAEVDGHARAAAAVELVAADHAAGIVDVRDEQHLLAPSGETGDEVCGDALRLAQTGLLRAVEGDVRLITALCGADEREKFRRAGTDALDLFELVGGRLEHRVQRAEVFHQPVCERVGVALAHREKQQHFEQFVVIEGVHAEFMKLVEHSAAVPAMQIVRHVRRLLSPSCRKM